MGDHRFARGGQNHERLRHVARWATSRTAPRTPRAGPVALALAGRFARRGCLLAIVLMTLGLPGSTGGRRKTAPQAPQAPAHKEERFPAFSSDFHNPAEMGDPLPPREVDWFPWRSGEANALKQGGSFEREVAEAEFNRHRLIRQINGDRAVARTRVCPAHSHDSQHTYCNCEAGYVCVGPHCDKPERGQRFFTVRAKNTLPCSTCRCEPRNCKQHRLVCGACP